MVLLPRLPVRAALAQSVTNLGVRCFSSTASDSHSRALSNNADSASACSPQLPSPSSSEASQPARNRTPAAMSDNSVGTTPENMEWASNTGDRDRCNSLFTCFDGQPSRLTGSTSFDFSPPRVVGSLGDSTWFGADSEAAAAAAAAAAPALSMSDKYNGQFNEVRKLLKAKGLFTDATVDTHSLEYYNHLGLNEFYFQTANPAAIADNLLAVIAARALHSASGADYFPEIRQVDEKTGDVFALARASLTNRKASQNYKVEQQFEQEFLDMGLSRNKQQMRMQCYRSTGSVFGIDGDTERLRTYFFQKPKFPLAPEQVRDEAARPAG